MEEEQKEEQQQIKAKVSRRRVAGGSRVRRKGRREGGYKTPLMRKRQRNKGSWRGLNQCEVSAARQEKHVKME